jgi:chorismate synthase
VQGGISNGEDVFLRVAFKPTATINREQRRPSTRSETPRSRRAAATTPACCPRAVPIVEAMLALVLADHALRQRGQCG